MNALDGTGSGRPNDARNFVHKKILGLGSKVLGFAASNIPLPGAGILGFASDVLGGFAGPGPTAPSVIGLPINGARLGTGNQRSRFPGDDIERVIRAKQFGQEASRQVAPVNGTCPAPVLGGNRRINAAGMQACPGFHWNESTYTRLGGPCSTKPAGLVVKGTEQVKNRRKFNTANGPARKRAIQRLKAGEGDAKDALRAMGYRTITKRSARELRAPARRTRHR